jgi:hypothetical protein
MLSKFPALPAPSFARKKNAGSAGGFFLQVQLSIKGTRERVKLARAKKALF